MRNTETIESRAKNTQVYPRGRSALNPVDIRYVIPFNAAQAPDQQAQASSDGERVYAGVVSGFKAVKAHGARPSIRPSGAERGGDAPRGMNSTRDTPRVVEIYRIFERRFRQHIR